MAQAKIDENYKPTLLLYNETTGLVEPARVDLIFGAIECFGVASDGNTPTALNRASIDGNDKPTMLLYNETTGLVEAARCGSNGELIVIEV